MANRNFHREMLEVPLADSAGETLSNADGCILQADWPEFKRMTAADFLKVMGRPVVVDGRRILNPEKMKGVRFRRIGSP